MYRPHFDRGEQRRNIYRANFDPLRSQPEPLLCCQNTKNFRNFAIFVPGGMSRCSRRRNTIREVPEEIGGDL